MDRPAVLTHQDCVFESPLGLSQRAVLPVRNSSIRVATTVVQFRYLSKGM